MVWLLLLVAAVAGFVGVPRLGFALAHAPAPLRAPWLPWLSVALFMVAWWLPNPALAHTSTFVQHAVGGGAACAAAALFVAVNAGLRSSILRVGLAYAVSATLGVGVELAELALDTVRGTNVTADSVWDLLANTMGAITMAVLVELALLLRPAASTR